ncbi:RHTO0S01e04698g1_1 [Rhodotorula toruloides]|uniref:RHTO0S01e04698g1_1 n=2 Tax=Rhodotorula toruloides TaxID=5286 RepID=A0A061AK24_RHOTO|nr:uncharacterized protein RHTO_01479 [Rhodotorula toruloides NP11]EMS21832.1 hypothetical protein RHTO_01479 [Rhodotorula toruloides NP11]CDR35678.1 RHTO0S01e04698g1_1 [Rhodotorula toruloides]
MATLERPVERAASDSPVLAQRSTFSPSAIPSPFPEHELPRGRPAGPGPVLARQQAVAAGEQEHSESRSRGGTRRSLSRVVDRVKRAMSASRDRQGEQERGRRMSADTVPTVEEPRGRSPLSAFRPRSLSRGPSARSMHTVNEEGSTVAASMYPLSKSQTRSSSRGRAPPGGKIFSTGRGGAGNLIGVSPNEDMREFDGEEDPNVVRLVREDRSRSRERDGRVEVATTGRGGRGNMRSSSRGRDLELGRVPTVMEEQERADREDDELRLQELLKKREREPGQFVSTGRGGAGNISFFRRNTTDAVS